MDYTARQASLSFIISWSVLKLMSIESMLSSHVILCHSLLLPSFFPSVKVFSSESTLHIRWPKYWSFSFSISPSNEYSELISFRIDWFDLLAVQETLESSPAPQFESINPLTLSLTYGPTLTSILDYWKSHSFEYMDLCCKVMSLLLILCLGIFPTLTAWIMLEKWSAYVHLSPMIDCELLKKGLANFL